MRATYKISPIYASRYMIDLNSKYYINHVNISQLSTLPPQHHNLRDGVGMSPQLKSAPLFSMVPFKKNNKKICFFLWHCKTSKATKSIKNCIYMFLVYHWPFNSKRIKSMILTNFRQNFKAFTTFVL